METRTPGAYPLPHTLRRLAFNLALRRDVARDPPDLAVGFDIDGWALPPAGRRACPLVVSLKGVAADEARHERDDGGGGSCGHVSRVYP